MFAIRKDGFEVRFHTHLVGFLADGRTTVVVQRVPPSPDKGNPPLK